MQLHAPRPSERDPQLPTGSRLKPRLCCADDIDSNTHQSDHQGYQSFEHGAVRQENESSYERRPTETEHPGLHPGRDQPAKGPLLAGIGGAGGPTGAWPLPLGVSLAMGRCGLGPAWQLPHGSLPPTWHL